MRADVAERAAGAGALRIGAPLGLLLAGGLGRVGQPVLRVLDLHEADLAELAVLHHLARVAHHRIAGVVVRQGEDAARLLDRACSFFASASERQRLVADDVDAGLEEGVVGPACRWLGVTMATASMPSGRCASAFAMLSKSP